jgi:hypothetical protein
MTVAGEDRKTKPRQVATTCQPVYVGDNPMTTNDVQRS